MSTLYKETSAFEADFKAMLTHSPWEIGPAIQALNELYHAHYGLDPYRINCGACETFADLLSKMIPGCEWSWGDELISPGEDPDQYAYHCVVRYQGRFYDSEHPLGVDDFRSISAFSNGGTIQSGGM